MLNDKKKKKSKTKTTHTKKNNYSRVCLSLTDPLCDQVSRKCFMVRGGVEGSRRTTDSEGVEKHR